MASLGVFGFVQFFHRLLVCVILQQGANATVRAPVNNKWVQGSIIDIELASMAENYWEWCRYGQSPQRSLASFTRPPWDLYPRSFVAADMEIPP